MRKLLTILSFVSGVVFAGTANAQQQPPQPPLFGCNSPQQAGFDFWVGDWDVYPNGSDKKAADSKIEKLHNGCAIRESWMPLKGPGGSSLSNFEPRSGRWQQVWIGSNPGRVEFQGGYSNNTMVMTGYWPNVLGPGKDALVRMTYSVNKDGSVRQLGEQSVDQGVTWAKSFDFIYRRKAVKAAKTKGKK